MWNLKPNAINDSLKDGMVFVTIWKVLLKRNQEAYSNVIKLAKGN